MSAVYTKGVFIVRYSPSVVVISMVVVVVIVSVVLVEDPIFQK